MVTIGAGTASHGSEPAAHTGTTGAGTAGADAADGGARTGGGEAPLPGTAGDAERRPTRERILDAAVELFGRSGYSGTSVGEIEAAAGLTPRSGALYKHFASKRALLEAAVQRRARVAERAGELVGELATGDVRAEARLYGRESLRIVREDQPLMRIVMREGDSFPELRDEFRERIVRRGQASTVAWLERAARRTGAAEADLNALAALILGWIINHCVLGTLFGETPGGLSDEEFLDRWTDSTTRLLASHGLVPDERQEGRR